MDILKFKRHHGIYSPNDIAGFAPDAAARLVSAKIAEPYDAEIEPVLSPVVPAEEPKRRGRGKADP